MTPAMKLHEVPTNGRFKVNGQGSLLTGTVLRHGSGSTLVQYDRETVVEVNGKTFTRRERTHIAPNTEVTPL